MANGTPTSMDNKELPMIKYLKDIKAASERTGDLVKNESTANSIIASALPEVLNDTRLYYARETLDTKQGLFEIDDYLRAMLLQDAKYYGGGILMEQSLKDLVKSTNDLKPLFTTISGSVDDMSNEVTESLTDNKKKDKTQAQLKEESKEEYMKQTEGEKKTAGYFKGLGDKFDGFKKSFIGKLIKTDLILVGILLAIAYFRPLAEVIERFFRTTGKLFRGEQGFFEYIGNNFILMGGIALVLFRKTLSILLARVLLGGPAGMGFFQTLFLGFRNAFTKLLFFLRLPTVGKATKMKFFTRAIKVFFLAISRLGGFLVGIPVAIYGFLEGFFKGFDRVFQRSEKGILGFIGALISGSVQGLIGMVLNLFDFFTFGVFSDIIDIAQDFDFAAWFSNLFSAILSGVGNGIAAVGDSFLSLFSSKPVGVTGSVNPLTVKENDKRFAAMSGSNINNRTSINNFTTVNANNNSSRSDTTVSNRSVDNTGYGSQNAGLT